MALSHLITLSLLVLSQTGFASDIVIGPLPKSEKHIARCEVIQPSGRLLKWVIQPSADGERFIVDSYFEGEAGYVPTSEYFKLRDARGIQPNIRTQKSDPLYGVDLVSAERERGDQPILRFIVRPWTSQGTTIGVVYRLKTTLFNPLYGQTLPPKSGVEYAQVTCTGLTQMLGL